MAEKEYIERKSLCEDLKQMAKYQEPYKQSTILGVVSTIEGRKAADVVEVVRCKDCVSCRALRRNDRFEALFPEGRVYCMNYDCGKSPDDFCSEGERREQE